jgi:preprotein translocase subunit YajC
MLYDVLLLLAEDPAPKSGGGGIFGGNTILFLLPIILLLYFFIVVLPGKRRAERERQDAMNKMEKGTEVLTIGGIYGTVISVHPEKDEIVVKVDDGTRLRMTKGSIARNITAEEAAKKAKETSASTAVTPATGVTGVTATPNQTK